MSQNGRFSIPSNKYRHILKKKTESYVTKYFWFQNRWTFSFKMTVVKNTIDTARSASCLSRWYGQRARICFTNFERRERIWVKMADCRLFNRLHSILKAKITS
jgi:hypothetical protein